MTPVEQRIKSALRNVTKGDWPDVGTIGGADIQQLAHKHGLFEQNIQNAPCAEEGCNFVGLVSDGDWKDRVVCYTKTPLLTGNVTTAREDVE